MRKAVAIVVALLSVLAGCSRPWQTSSVDPAPLSPDPSYAPPPRAGAYGGPPWAVPPETARSRQPFQGHRLPLHNTRINMEKARALWTRMGPTHTQGSQARTNTIRHHRRTLMGRSCGPGPNINKRRPLVVSCRVAWLGCRGGGGGGGAAKRRQYAARPHRSGRLYLYFGADPDRYFGVGPGSYECYGYDCNW